MSFSAGFSINPERLTTNSVFTTRNRLTLTVTWRLRKMCSPVAATQISTCITANRATCHKVSSTGTTISYVGEEGGGEEEVEVTGGGGGGEGGDKEEEEEEGTGEKEEEEEGEGRRKGKGRRLI